MPLPVGFFFFALPFPNGLGSALFGTDNICLTAARNRSNASGPSIMSDVPDFTVFILTQF